MPAVKSIFVLAAIFLLQALGFGQSRDLPPIKRCLVKTLNIEDGLLHTVTNSILMDAYGFTWVSTRLGMQRYNGYRLENVNPVVGRDTLYINTPVYFFGLKNQHIWISHSSGILEFNPGKNEFSNITRISRTGRSYFPIIPLLETKDAIWCMQENKGIVLYRKGQFNSWKEDPEFIRNINQAMSTEDILSRKIAAVNDIHIFLRLNAGQILHINTQTQQFEYLTDFSGELLSLGCDSGKLYLETTNEIHSFLISPHRLLKKIPVRLFYHDNPEIGCIQCLGNHSMLLGLNGVLVILDSNLTVKEQLATLDREPLGNGSFKHQVYLDPMNRFWILSNNDIEVVPNTEVPFEHFSYPSSRNNSTRALYYDKENEILLAGCIHTNERLNGGIRVFDTLSRPLWNQPLISPGLGSINAIEKLSSHFFLITTFDRHGWFLFDYTQKKISPFTLNTDAQTKSALFSNQWVNNLQRINDSTIYMASPARLFRCVFRNNRLVRATTLFPTGGGPSSEEISCFLQTHVKTVWVGTNSGRIYRFKEGKDLESLHIHGDYIIRCFTEDSLGHVWVGTDKGVYVYDPTGNLLRLIDRTSGLLSDYIYALLPVGKSESVFASSNRGLSFISLGGTIRNYTHEQGLQSNEFNTEAALKTESGKFYFGGVNGINGFYPEALTESTDTPVLNITSLIINDSPFHASTGGWVGDSLHLKYPQNHLQLDIAGLGLFNTDEYNYSYRLTPFENSWQTTHHPTGIRYNLSPGKYVLEIKCSPIQSPDKIFYKRLFIDLSPPWWETWWMRILALSLFTGVLAWTIYQFNKRRFAQKLREIRIQQEIQQERERISRDLHDNLGAHAAAIAVNLGKARESQVSARVIEDLHYNSQAIVHQLNDTIWALNREAISFTAIGDRFKLFLQKIQPSYPQLKINISERISQDCLFSPTHALHLFRMMQEAVNNAARHSHCENLWIDLESGSQSRWKLSITDDGKGMGDSPRNGTGNGLRNMRHRAAEAGWRVSWQNHPPQGTMVTIEPLPG